MFLNQCRNVSIGKETSERMWMTTLCLLPARSWRKYFNIKCSSVWGLKLRALRLNDPSVNPSFHSATRIQWRKVCEASGPCWCNSGGLINIGYSLYFIPYNPLMSSVSPFHRLRDWVGSNLSNLHKVFKIRLQRHNLELEFSWTLW